MFDVGFSEMLVIGIVALLVIGPAKLPSVARTVGALLGRMQRYVNDVKADINREIELDELKNLQTTVQDAARSIETSVTDTMSTFQTQADELNKIASGDIAGLTETKAVDGPAAEPAAVTPSAGAGAQAEESAMLAAIEAAPGPAATLEAPLVQTTQVEAPLGEAPLVESPSVESPAVESSLVKATSGDHVENGSQSGSQGTLSLEPLTANAAGAANLAKPVIAAA